MIHHYYVTISLFALSGVGLGGMVASLPKAALDLVTQEEYPLAMGVVSSTEGVVDICLPVLIGGSHPSFFS